MSSTPENRAVMRRRWIAAPLYGFAVVGAVGNAAHVLQPVMTLVMPFMIVGIGVLAVSLTYEVSIRSLVALGSVLVLVFAAVASGVNLGFPFGEFAYTSRLGPKVVDVPVVIPFAWLAILIPAWAAAGRFLKYKHLIVASVLATAADAVLEFAADSLDLWHWKDGLPTELNYITWFIVSYLALAILQTHAKERAIHWIVPHLLSAQLLYFVLSDAGLRFLFR
jgi:putative membrane protein